MLQVPVATDPATFAMQVASASEYETVRSLTERLCAPLEIDDYGVQSMPEASPAKWHLAHTSWFFETFVLSEIDSCYRPFDPRFSYLFNSYYNAVGPFWPRSQRGQLARPTVDTVYQYRKHVDHAMQRLLSGGFTISTKIRERIVLGLNHEQQHQELLLTDLKHAFACNPLRPIYFDPAPPASTSATPLRWLHYPGGQQWIGHDDSAFVYDNEKPRHHVYVAPFQFASRLTTCGEYLSFIEDGGYERAELWLSDGWATRNTEKWSAPLYWEHQDGEWVCMTLGGMRAILDREPVCHLSYYEADAFARWSGARLPTEAEWETVACSCPLEGSFLDLNHLHPRPLIPANCNEDLSQMFGELWQWTGSAYLPYPGYQPDAGALGEYNGKFMCNQFVLRGGSCATPRSHFRPTYRNFFPPQARWQFTGIRLANDA